MSEKYRITSSLLDGFKVSFSRKECILAERHYPLGYFAVEYLELDRTFLRELERLIPIFQEEFTIFLSARDPSSAALAQQALNAVWDVLIQLPVYRHLGQYGGGVCGLLWDMKDSHELVDEMLTPGTGRSEMLREWMGRLTTLSASIEKFIRSTNWMLGEYFSDLSSRKPEDYALAFGKYQRDVAWEYRAALDKEAGSGTASELKCQFDTI